MKNCYPDDWQWLVMNSRPLRSETTILGLVWWSHHNENVGSNPTPNVISNLHDSGKKTIINVTIILPILLLLLLLLKPFPVLFA